MNPACLQYRLTDEERRTFNDTGLLVIEDALTPSHVAALTEATDIADEFLDEDKLIVYTQGEHSARAEYHCNKDGVFEKGKLVAGTEFGGGREFPFPDGSMVRSGNITPDAASGIGNWSEEMFMNLFHSRSDSATLARKLAPGEFNSIMPWTMYGKMADEDLKAIYAYLKTVGPISNKVEKFTAAVAK